MSDQPKKPTPEEVEASFKEVIEDVVDVASKLAIHCNNNIDDMVAVMRLALENDSQLRLLLSVTTAPKK